ncbi:hypothetical protein FB451DRAFT_1376011 [Mycena latifolia]|nr:hypothetical protein FB451DRAFT_1376011 [Mycena latifolia]
MHTVVEIIPLLLHASLLFFFAGLVAFLIPVNRAMTMITMVLLGIVAGVYAILTLLPLRYTDSPYRTPLSGTFWRLFQSVQSLWERRHTPHNQPSIHLRPSRDESMVEAMFRAATEPSEERSARDHRALVWTMKSLADENDLEPFIEAIPDVLWGPTGKRHASEVHLQHLAHDPEAKLLSRIQGHLNSCETGILCPEAAKRRGIACYKALWAIASPCKPALSADDVNYSVDFSQFNDSCPTFHDILRSDMEAAAYLVSAKAMMEWSTFCGALEALDAHHEYLITCTEEISKGHNPDLTPVISFVEKYSRPQPFTGDLYASSAFLIPQLQEFLAKFRLETPYIIQWNYYSTAASVSSAPYRWSETGRSIILEPGVKSQSLVHIVEHYLTYIIYTLLNKLTSDLETPYWIEESVSTLLSFWHPDDDRTIPRAIIRLLNECKDSALDNVLISNIKLQQNLWARFPRTVTMGPSMSGWFAKTESLPREATFTAL